MSAKVIGIGDNVVDKYLHTGVMYPGGNALNFAVYAKSLGCQAAYIGIFGNDPEGDYVSSILKQLDIDTSHCRVMRGENGYACIDIVDGDRVFLRSNKGGVARLNPIHLSEQDISFIKGFDLIHSSINSHIEPQLPLLRSAGVPVSYDFSNKATEEYCSQVCPYIDYGVISCGSLSEEETAKLIDTLHRHGTPYVIATRGSKGSIFSDGTQLYHHNADPITAKDTLGAGDAFLTAFLISYNSWLQDLKGGKALPDQKDDAVQRAMEAGGKKAAEVCMVDGAFGYGTAIIA